VPAPGNRGPMSRVAELVRDDRVLPLSRGVSRFILPFLIIGFLVLYPFPDATDWAFAWTIHPTMTPMTLASAYLGGAYYFYRAQRAAQWHHIKSGFPAVALFAALLGIATVLHWDRFHHHHVAFWIWTALYFVAPFLVLAAWLANRRHEAPARIEETRLPSAVRWMLAVTGALATVTGALMFLAPATVIPIWPWLLTPLTCRVIGAIFCLGSALLVVLVDSRVATMRLMLEVALIMIVSIDVAAVRARGEFFTDRPLTWILALGFVSMLLGCASLVWRLRRTETG
jgi:hypothetical protein